MHGIDQELYLFEKAEDNREYSLVNLTVRIDSNPIYLREETQHLNLQLKEFRLCFEDAYSTYSLSLNENLLSDAKSNNFWSLLLFCTIIMATLIPGYYAYCLYYEDFHHHYDREGILSGVRLSSFTYLLAALGLFKITTTNHLSITIGIMILISIGKCPPVCSVRNVIKKLFKKQENRKVYAKLVIVLNILWVVSVWIDFRLISDLSSSSPYWSS